jgi:adenylate kinase family enzyme
MRIYITGSSGAGKSTYAKKLSKEFNIPMYRTDDLYNSIEERMFTLEEIEKRIPINSDWIIEGAYYIPKYIRIADKVIYIKVGKLKTVSRISGRWFKEKEIRSKFSFLSTLRLVYTTLRDIYASENIDVNTKTPRHYKERDRYNLCKANAREFVIKKG